MPLARNDSCVGQGILTRGLRDRRLIKEIEIKLEQETLKPGAMQREQFRSQRAMAKTPLAVDGLEGFSWTPPFCRFSEQRKALESDSEVGSPLQGRDEPNERFAQLIFTIAPWIATCASPLMDVFGAVILTSAADLIESAPVASWSIVPSVHSLMPPASIAM